MKNLCDYMTVEMLKLNHSCSCGARHVCDLPEVYTENPVDVVKKVLSMGHVLTLTQEDVDGEFCEELGKGLCRAGYRVSNLTLLPFCQSVDTDEIDEDVRLIVAIGGNALQEIAKRLCYERNIKLMSVPTGMTYGSLFFDEVEIVTEGMVVRTDGKMPDVIYVDYPSLYKLDDEIVASAYGYDMSKLIGLADRYFVDRIEGKPCCNEIFTCAVKTIAKLLANKCDVHSTMSIKLLSDTGLRLGILEKLSGRIRGGEYALTRCIERYSYVGLVDRRLFGENSFLSAMIVGKMYESYLENHGDGFSVPPDRGRTCVKMRKLLRIPDTYSLPRLIRRGVDNEVYEYKIALYQKEFLDIIKRINLMMKEGLGFLRRIYDDAGFYMKYYLTKEEIKDLISVSADFGGERNFLYYLNQGGLVEKLGVTA